METFKAFAVPAGLAVFVAIVGIVSVIRFQAANRPRPIKSLNASAAYR